MVTNRKLYKVRVLTIYMGIVKTIKENIGKTIFSLSVAGVATLAGIGPKEYSGCVPYQGHHINRHEEFKSPTFVFDPLPLKYRQGEPQYELPTGLFVNTNDLEMGQEYALTIKDPLLGGPRIVSADPCTR